MKACKIPSFGVGTDEKSLRTNAVTYCHHNNGCFVLFFIRNIKEYDTFGGNWIKMSKSTKA